MDKNKDVFENSVATYIKDNNLLHFNAPVIVALSGGADSVALLAALVALGYDCRAAHCNFHLRGNESNRDMLHCQELCKAIGNDLYVIDFDVKARMEQTGESVEMACRGLRYDWFRKLADRDSAQAIAVGHHKEDRAETFMLNLMRGAGIIGLTSMNVRSGDVIRPLLSLSRKDIEEYLDRKNLSYVNDSSNSSDLHRRNRIRNSIFPMLEQAFPGALDAVLKSIANLEAARQIYLEAVNNIAQKYTEADNSIKLADLSALPQAQTILFEMLKGHGFKFPQICDMISSVGQSGSEFFSPDGSTVAELSHGIIHLVDAATRQKNSDFAITVNPCRSIFDPIRIDITLHAVENFSPSQNGAMEACFDADFVSEPATWEIRHYRRGDRIVPFGSSKSKLISDIFSNAKFSQEQKRNAWILTRNGIPVWIPGLRNSAEGALGPSTTKYYKMSYIHNT